MSHDRHVRAWAPVVYLFLIGIALYCGWVVVSELFDRSDPYRLVLGVWGVVMAVAFFVYWQRDFMSDRDDTDDRTS